MLTSSRLSKTIGMVNITRCLSLTRRVVSHHQHFRAALFSTDISITTLPMPSLSPTMTHGTISSWNKAPGDVLSAGDILCDVETDKASVGFEVQDDGILAKILVDASGAEIECGQPIALMVDDEDDYKIFLTLPPEKYAVGSAASPSSSSGAVSPEPQQSQALAPAETVSATPATSTSSSARLSPAARHIVQSKALDPASISGTSKGGRVISKGDVLSAVKNGTARNAPAAAPTKTAAPAAAAAAPSPTKNTGAPTVSNGEGIGGTFTDVPNSNMRKVIAKRLSESKQTVPHHYTTMECEIDELLALRKNLKNDFGVNVSVNDVVIKSAAMALRDVPECNGKWVPAEGQAVLNDMVDISVAVATPNGLITPILASADTLGLSAINNKVKDLATRARDGKLQPSEYQGGTFTISNLGMFGISSFSAVINPPQACILAVGGGIQRVMAPTDGQSQPRVATTMTVQLSSDRRVVDEATASQFLQAFRYYLSNPKLVIL